MRWRLIASITLVPVILLLPLATALPPPAVATDVFQPWKYRPVEPGESTCGGVAEAYASSSLEPRAWAYAKVSWVAACPMYVTLLGHLEGDPASLPEAPQSASGSYDAVSYTHRGGVRDPWGHWVQEENSGCLSCSSPPYAQTTTWLARCWDCTTMEYVGAYANARAT